MAIKICVFCGACDYSKASMVQATRGLIWCHVGLSVKAVTLGLLSKFLFNRCKLIDTERSELDKFTGGAAMLLLLRRVMKDVPFAHSRRFGSRKQPRRGTGTNDRRVRRNKEQGA